MFSAPILEALKGGLVRAYGFEVSGRAVSVLSLWVARGFVGSRCAIGVDYSDEGAGGGNEEGF